VRFAVVTTSYPETDDDPSGHFVRAEVDALTREGHDVEVFAARGEAFGWPGALGRLRDKPWRALAGARELLRLRRALACAHAERIVAHWALPSGLVARGLGPIELVSHGADVRLLVRLPRRARAAMVRALCNDAVAWRFVSDTLLSELLAALPRAEATTLERIAFVRASPIELPPRASLPAVERRRPESPLVVTVGRLIRLKRIDRVIDHVAKSPGTELVIVGDGPERRRLERHALTRGVDARFVGLVPRLEALAWISAADTLVHASEGEGFSTVLREAEAFGTPVVVVHSESKG
jgi:glycosyltransferase involved in cell wall biosynthesis